MYYLIRFAMIFVCGIFKQRRIHGEKWGDNIHGERGARAYIGGLGVLPPVRYSDKALVGGQKASPPEADKTSAIQTLILK
jgi:hypothetical protein